MSNPVQTVLSFKERGLGREKFNALCSRMGEAFPGQREVVRDAMRAVMALHNRIDANLIRKWLVDQQSLDHRKINVGAYTTSFGSYSRLKILKKVGQTKSETTKGNGRLINVYVRGHNWDRFLKPGEE